MQIQGKTTFLSRLENSSFHVTVAGAALPVALVKEEKNKEREAVSAFAKSCVITSKESPSPLNAV